MHGSQPGVADGHLQDPCRGVAGDQDAGTCVELLLRLHVVGSDASINTLMLLDMSLMTQVLPRYQPKDAAMTEEKVGLRGLKGEE